VPGFADTVLLSRIARSLSIEEGRPVRLAEGDRIKSVPVLLQAWISLALIVLRTLRTAKWLRPPITSEVFENIDSAPGFGMATDRPDLQDLAPGRRDADLLDTCCPRKVQIMGNRGRFPGGGSQELESVIQAADVSRLD
jgi:hypothetical protein